MYKAYLEERTPGTSAVYSDKGFCTYSITEEECYIIDLYVKPEYRFENVASEFGDQISEIARNAGCKYLSGTVATNTANPTASTLVLIAYGFSIHVAKDELIIFKKDL